MKKRILALLVLTVLLAGCTGPVHVQTAAPAAEPEPAETAQAAPEVEGDEGLPNAVDLYFPANPTTGYSWTAEVENPAVAEVEEQYYPDSASLGMVGVGGRQWYRIHGLEEGVTSVTFRYGRPWEDTAATTYLYRIQVDAKRNVIIWGVEVDPKGTDG
ncbi:MAG: protease inhibitor I42 family protein [Oscillospiraceae bacterium]|nr:protease inhibitor I42 family protein [Oscillospiraceae bacterium]